MSWVGRFGRIGGFALMAGVSGCGKTLVQARPSPLEEAARCADTPAAHRLTVAFAGATAPTDSTSDPGTAPAVRALLTGIAIALPSRSCVTGNSSLAGADDTVTVHHVRDADARDVLEEGADVLVTRDQVVAAYARARPGLTVLALPWDRAYVLVVADPLSRDDSAVTQLRSALATDADRADARPFAEDARPAADACGSDLVHRSNLATAARSATRMPDARQVVYDAEDSVARFLAERVAYLASARGGPLTKIAPALDSPGTEMSVRGLPSNALSRALLDGSAAAYIVAIPIGGAPCDQLGHAPPASSSSGPAGGDESPRTIALIETRALAIVRLDAAARIAAGARSDDATLVPVRQP